MDRRAFLGVTLGLAGGRVAPLPGIRRAHSGKVARVGLIIGECALRA